MPNPQAIIADLTGPEVVVAIVPGGASPDDVRLDMKVPWAVAFRLQNGELQSFAGNRLHGINEDDRTILFDHLHEDLQRIENVELQDRIVDGFWQALYDDTAAHDLLDPTRVTVVFFVTPYVYPQLLLERFRRKCESKNRLVLGGLVNEALALTVGFLRSPYLKDQRVPGDPTKLTLLSATTNALEVVSVTYRYEEAPVRYHVRIREFFRTSYEELPERLGRAMRIRAQEPHISLESTSLSSQHRAVLETALTGVGNLMRHETDDADRLKVAGAAYTAMCALGQREDGDEFSIEAPTNIGVQLNQRLICPIVHKHDLIALTEFPYETSKAFKLRGDFDGDVPINLYSGFSGRVAESSLLASVLISRRELTPTRNASADLTLSVKLEASGAGVFNVGLPHSNRIVAGGRFALPGLVV